MDFIGTKTAHRSLKPAFSGLRKMNRIPGAVSHQLAFALIIPKGKTALLMTNKPSYVKGSPSELLYKGPRSTQFVDCN